MRTESIDRRGLAPDCFAALLPIRASVILGSTLRFYTVLHIYYN